MWFPLAQVISHVVPSFPVFSYVFPSCQWLILCGSLLPTSSPMCFPFSPSSPTWSPLVRVFSYVVPSCPGHLPRVLSFQWLLPCGCHSPSASRGWFPRRNAFHHVFSSHHCLLLCVFRVPVFHVMSVHYQLHTCANLYFPSACSSPVPTFYFILNKSCSQKQTIGHICFLYGRPCVCDGSSACAPARYDISWRCPRFPRYHSVVVGESHFLCGECWIFKWCSLNYTPLSVTIFLRVPVTYTPYFLLLTFRRAGER